jgi:hypothetical protein
MRVTCTAHITFLHLIILILYNAVCKLWSSSLLRFLQPSAASSPLDPNIPLSTPFSDTLGQRYSFMTGVLELCDLQLSWTPHSAVLHIAVGFYQASRWQQEPAWLYNLSIHRESYLQSLPVQWWKNLWKIWPTPDTFSESTYIISSSIAETLQGYK